MSQELDIYIDGASKGNPGDAAVGIVINKQGGERLKEIAREIGQATNNVAEYTALIFALQEAAHLKADALNIFTDSELVYNQLAGQYKVRDSKIQLLFDQVKPLLNGFKRVDLKHIPREQNKEADKLASSVLKKKKQAKVVASTFRLK